MCPDLDPYIETQGVHAVLALRSRSKTLQSGLRAQTQTSQGENRPVGFRILAMRASRRRTLRMQIPKPKGLGLVQVLRLLLGRLIGNIARSEIGQLTEMSYWHPK